MLALVILVPLVGALVYAIHATRASAVEESAKSSLQLATLAGTGVSQFIDDSRKLMQALTRRPGIFGWQARGCDPLLRVIPQIHPEYANIVLLNVRGDVVCSAVPQTHGPTPVAASQWFRTVRATRRFTVGDPFFGPITHRWVSVLALPLYRGGRVSGYLALPVDLARYQGPLQGLRLPNQAVISIVDRHNIVVARSAAAERWVGRRVPDSATAGAKATTRKGFDGVVRVVSSAPVPGTSWTAYAGVPEAVALAPASALGRRLSAAAVVAALLGTAAALLLARRIIRPIRRLAARAEAIAEGDKAARAEEGGPREIAIAARQFNHMLEARTAVEAKQQQLTEQLAQAQKMEAIGQLAGGIAHDFNNLIQVIAGYGELTLNELAPHEENARVHVQEMIGAGERAAALTRQLLVYSRRQALHLHVIDLNDEVRGIERLLQRVLSANIELRLKLQPSLWPVSADSGEIGQVILNLAVNARDAMPTGGVLTIATTNVRVPPGHIQAPWTAEAGEYVRLTVSDTGTGVAESDRAHVFEPFYTTKAIGEGTGLGLSTVYGIVKQSDGYIELADTGEGATFHVYLPHTTESSPKRDGQPLTTAAAGKNARPPSSISRPERYPQALLPVEEPVLAG